MPRLLAGVLHDGDRVALARPGAVGVAVLSRGDLKPLFSLPHVPESLVILHHLRHGRLKLRVVPRPDRVDVHFLKLGRTARKLSVIVPRMLRLIPIHSRFSLVSVRRPQFVRDKGPSFSAPRSGCPLARLPT